MNRTLVPRVGKSFSTIGLGCVTFGREIHQADSFAIMDFARESGVSFFDTAASYGSGASEKIVGAWLSSRKAFESILIGTKIQPPYESKHIEQSVSESLKNLKTDSIDLLYLHRWDAAIENLRALKALNDLIIAGKIKMIGASNFNAEQLKKVLHLQIKNGFQCFESVQNNNNLAVSDINEELRKICVTHDIKIVSYSPLGAGFLTGKYRNGVKRDTRFDRIRGHQGIYFNETGFRRLNKLEAMSAATGYSQTHLALAWAIHQPGISSVLVGCRSKEQFAKALTAIDYNDSSVFNELIC